MNLRHVHQFPACDLKHVSGSPAPSQSRHKAAQTGLDCEFIRFLGLFVPPPTPQKFALRPKINRAFVGACLLGLL